jgi:hypothetical protein
LQDKIQITGVEEASKVVKYWCAKALIAELISTAMLIQ